jgi:hypothetical protein
MRAGPRASSAVSRVRQAERVEQESGHSRVATGLDGLNLQTHLEPPAASRKPRGASVRARGSVYENGPGSPAIPSDPYSTSLTLPFTKMIFMSA